MRDGGLGDFVFFQKYFNDFRDFLENKWNKNIFEQIDNIVIRILEGIESYEFSSFETGIIIKPSLIDRDDHIKSEFQIKGVSSIKSNINNELSKKLARKTKTGISHTDSDLVIKVDFKDSSYEIKSKPIYIYGRYTKASRTITQKQRNCTKCMGKGCYTDRKSVV